MKSSWILAGAAATMLVGLAYLIGPDDREDQLVAFQMSDIETPPSTRADPVGGDVPEMSDELKAQFERLIRSYLLQNPEVIAEAIEELQVRQQQAELDAAANAIVDHAEALFQSERHIVLGNPDGDTTLVEFYDYNCAFCRRAMADVKRLLETDSELRLVMKEFPILGEGSVEAARVSVAVGRLFPDSFERFHFALMSETGRVDGGVAIAIAEEVGIDIAALTPVLDSDEIDAAINEVYELAEPLNLTGTPSFVTPKEVIVGAVGYDALREKIAAARAGE